MIRRPGFVVDHTQPAYGGESPNAYVARISVQVRCNWPPRATVAEVRQALDEGYKKALAELGDHRTRWALGQEGYRYNWVE